MPLILGASGYLGSGKSLATYGIIKDDYQEGYVIYTNRDLKILPNKRINWNKLLTHALLGTDFPDPKIVWDFDEIEYYLDARASMDLTHLIYSYFLYQIRKRKHRLRYTSTSPYLADLRMRNETEITIKCSKWHEGKNGLMCTDPECRSFRHYFEYKVINNIEERETNVFEVHDPDATQLLNEYDSYEILSPATLLPRESLISIMEKLHISPEDIQKALERYDKEYDSL